MNTMCRSLIPFALISISSWTVASSQQSPIPPAAPPAQSQAAPPADPSGVAGQIVFDAVVTDKSGKPVSGLQLQDFTILDNRQPARVLSMRPLGGAADEAHATEVILVLDEVNSIFELVQHERAGVRAFLTRNGPQLPYPVSLAFFTEKGIQIQAHPSRNVDTLVAALDQHKLPPPRTGAAQGNGLVPPDQRFTQSLDALADFTLQEQATPWKKMVLWISPGWPTATSLPDTLGPSDKQRVFNSVVHYSTALRQARITL